MSTKRNIADDQAATAALLAQIKGRPNWLGHSGGAAIIDAALLVGATMEELSHARGAVQEHLRHLQNEHGLTVTNVDSVYFFAPSAA